LTTRTKAVVVGIVVAVIVAGLVVVGLRIFHDCRSWRRGYDEFLVEYMKRNTPFIPRQFLEEAEQRLGELPPGCQVPRSVTEAGDR
jgi:hypothetical protein